MNLLKPIDTFLNSITMYRLVLYGLASIALLALLESIPGWISYSPLSLIISAFLFICTCYISNWLFSKLFRVPTNVESYLITALILFLIFPPLGTIRDGAWLIAAGITAMASKYILVIHKKHLFNPAAISALLLGLIGFGATWWVGSASLTPLVIIVALLLIRKLRRVSMVSIFLATSILTIALFTLINGVAMTTQMSQVLMSWPLFFFAGIMLTEPLTTPPRRSQRLVYGGLVGILFGAQFHVGPLYASPELALILGNVSSYIMSPKQKFLLHLESKKQIDGDMYEVSFKSDPKPRFLPGQYVEWTLPHAHPDSRGNRRYFTIASSPTEDLVQLGVKVPENASSFKQALVKLQAGQLMVASQVAGDFTLPSDTHQKLVFLAGGIGITPFRSMVKFLLDTNQHRDIQLLYACSKADEFVYTDIFDVADHAGVRPTYIITHPDAAPANWSGKVGRLDEVLLKDIVPDYKDRTFYISGPQPMVQAYEHLLSQVGVSSNRVVTDYFPGF